MEVLLKEKNRLSSMIMTSAEEGNAREKSNLLINESSPYLLQHAHQPVQWYPWTEAAFREAKRLNRPVFLSIGYSTCHWCHVMARESFGDYQVALLLNEGFIPIKVDREERPDIDHTYMSVCQMLTGQGGWPLTIIMTPEKKPFFAATYLPKTTRFGMVGLLDLLPKVHEQWEKGESSLSALGDQITALLWQSSEGTGPTLDHHVLDCGYRDLLQRYDTVHGGFGDSPKFPSPHHLIFLLRYWWKTKESTAIQMVESTLREMRRGGIYDHVGFGFHRYAVDAAWLTPHFEKMLYDQALLALVYLEAFQATGTQWYARTAEEILTYVTRDLVSEQGGFLSAEDAESEGEEGKFYTWTMNELKTALRPGELLTLVGSFRIPTHISMTSSPLDSKGERIILALRETPMDIKDQQQSPVNTGAVKVRDVLTILYDIRQKRPHPQKDMKILADWNGLCIAALARAGGILSRPDYLAIAEKAMHFILERMRTKDGRLYHTSVDDVPRISGFIDDYAAVVWGLIELYAGTFNVDYLREALSLTDITLTYFWDTERGGYYFAPSDGEQLLIRNKETYDGAYPSGNALMMRNLLRLSHLTGREELEERANSIWKGCSGLYYNAPAGYTGLLTAAAEGLGSSSSVVIVGTMETDDTRSMADALRKHFLPAMDVLFVPSGEQREATHAVAPFVRAFPVEGKHPTAYICTGHTCQPPITSLEQLLRWLGKT